jgi:uncharacterized glyoxalase superfamily protein PhnB
VGVDRALAAEDVESAYRRAPEASSATVVAAEPKTKPWGQTEADVQAPEGVMML